MSCQRRGERGGCCLSILPVIAVVFLAVALVIGLETPPASQGSVLGPAHASTEAGLANYIATSVAAQMRLRSYATVALSDADLTMLAVAQNPDPSTFSQTEVFMSGGRMTVEAAASIAVLHVQTSVNASFAVAGHGPSLDIITSTSNFAIGRIPLPSWMRVAVDSRGNGVLNLTPMLTGGSTGTLVANEVDCLALQGHVMVIGFTRPGTPNLPLLCTQTQSAA